MSLFHNSPAVERVALGWHIVWSVMSFAAVVFACALMTAMYPLCFAPAPIGRYVFAQLCIQFTCAILGLGGTLHHALGARDHAMNLKKLEAKKAKKRG